MIKVNVDFLRLSVKGWFRKSVRAVYLAVLNLHDGGRVDSSELS